MHNKETETNLDYGVYVEKLMDLTRTEPEDKLKDALEERLSGGGPALMPGEGDLVDVLIHVYNGLRKEKDSRAMRRLRKLAVDLFTEALRAHENADPAGLMDAFTRVNLLGQMIAWFEVKKDGSLAQDLSDKLLGFLTRRLPTPLEEIMSLDGILFETAVHAFDLWLASISWREAFGWPPHFQTRMESLYKNNLQKIQANSKPDDMRIRLALLGFRAVLRCNPYWTGKNGFPEMMQCLSHLSQYSDKFVKRWLGLCHELGMVFKRNRNWREEFIKGMEKMDDEKASAMKVKIQPDFLKRTLEFMGVRDEIAQRSNILAPLDREKRIEAITEIKDVIQFPALRGQERMRAAK